MMLWHKNSAAAQKLDSGTKCNAAAHKTVLQHKNSAAECGRGMHNATAKTAKPKMTPSTTTATCHQKPIRLIVSPPSKQQSNCLHK